MLNFINKGKRGIVVFMLLILGLVALMPLYWVFTTALQLPDYQNETMKEPVSYVEAIPPKIYPVGITEYFSQWRKERAALKRHDTLSAEYHRKKMHEVVTKTFSSFNTLFQQTKILKWLLNSCYIAVIVTAGLVLMDTMAGYVLAKKRFPGRMIIFWMIVATMMIPEQVILVPTFIMVQKLRLFNTHAALVLPSFALAFGVFQMRQFLYSVPDEIIEAAKIDGASEWKTFWLIIVPLAKPAMAVLAIFTFIQSWNAFLWPIIAVSDVNMLTLPAGLKTLQDANTEDFKMIMSGASIAAIPMILIFILFQKNLIKGLTLGGVKE